MYKYDNHIIELNGNTSITIDGITVPIIIKEYKDPKVYKLLNKGVATEYQPSSVFTQLEGLLDKLDDPNALHGYARLFINQFLNKYS